MERSSARFLNTPFYADIARKHLDKAIETYKILREKDKVISKETDSDSASYLHYKATPIRDDLSEYYVISIIFSAMTLEAYIYDYLARMLTDKYVKTHLDKLNVINKYVVGTQLITSKAFPKDGEVFFYLKETIGNRNNLIHSKSKSIDLDNKEQLIETAKFHYSVFEQAKKAIKSLDLMAAYIDSIDPHEHSGMSFGIYPDTP